MSKQLSVKLAEKRYKDTRKKILDGCNFEIMPEEYVTILGPSGCGKSTLMKIIVGLDKDYEGEVVLGQRKVKHPAPDCSIVFQESRLLPWMTVKNNVKFALKRGDNGIDAGINDLLGFLDLADFERHYPVSLSGGMMQKLALARALVNLPDLLLLDEPFASLDYMTRIHLQEELIKVLRKRQTTVLMVTHDIEEAIYCSDRILIMSNKPAKIITSFCVDLPKPRDRAGDDFLQLYKRILNFMRTDKRLV